MDAPLTDPRVQRGAALAKSKGALIKSVAGSTFIVPSATHSGAHYVVDAKARSCSCPDWAECSAGATRAHQCKHVIAVLIVTHEIALPDGNSVIVTEVTKEKVYPRDFTVTNRSLVEVPRIGPALIHDLVSGIPLENVGPRTRGRPAVETRDVVHAAILKTFEHRTGRGTVEVMERNKRGGLWEREPMHYNTLLEKMANPSLMPIFQDLVSASARPLVNIARNFAIDSTGFTTSVYEARAWNRYQHGSKKVRRALAILRAGKKHQWVKCHACVDTDSLVITAVVMTERRVGDAPMMPELILRTVRDGFAIQKFTADAAYISTNNVEVIENVGGTPYIAFRKGMNGRTSPALTRLHAKITSDYEHYMHEYHARSKVETCFGVLKQQWGGNVNARKAHAMYAELMCKVVCHNIARIVHTACELNIDPKFWAPPSARQPTLRSVSATAPLIHMVTQ